MSRRCAVDLLLLGLDAVWLLLLLRLLVGSVSIAVSLRLWVTGVAVRSVWRLISLLGLGLLGRIGRLIRVSTVIRWRGCVGVVGVV